jgi:hypothetical protein
VPRITERSTVSAVPAPSRATSWFCSRSEPTTCTDAGPAITSTSMPRSALSCSHTSSIRRSSAADTTMPLASPRIATPRSSLPCAPPVTHTAAAGHGATAAAVPTIVTCAGHTPRSRTGLPVTTTFPTYEPAAIATSAPGAAAAIASPIVGHGRASLPSPSPPP